LRCTDSTPAITDCLSSTGVGAVVGKSEDVLSTFDFCSTTGDKSLGGDSTFNAGGNVLCDVGVLERPGGAATANVRGCCCNRFDEGVVGD
jgi:hypothetical protein